MSIILKAARLAAQYHANQKRKYSGKPYLTHLIRVAGRVLTHPEATEEMGAAAFLHDLATDKFKYIEICENIQLNCGYRVLQMVESLTNPSKGSKLPRFERKKIDREFLKTATKQVKIIKLADRIDNLSELINDLNSNFKVPIDFGFLYAVESELLLDHALKGTDERLESELMENIRTLQQICHAKQDTLDASALRKTLSSLL